MKRIRSKRCVVCNVQFTPYNSTLQKTCSVGCAVKFAKLKEASKNSDLTKNNIKDWNKVLQVKINQIVRLIDNELPCLARGTYPKQYHAGHVFSRGSNQTIRYNLHNIHRQSAQSNHFQNDDGLLREGLQKEYGKDYYEFISELRRTHPLKYTNEEYMHLTKKAGKIALRLRKSGGKYNLKERISLRNFINLELGIYDNKFCVFENKH